MFSPDPLSRALAVVNFFRWKYIVYERRMRKTGSDLAENLTHDAMLELAGQTYFDRGEDYHDRGRHDLRGGRVCR